MNSNILLSSEVETVLKKVLPECKVDLNIISGFCKLSTLQFLDSLIRNNIKKRLLIRFLPSDIASGSTDKEIYKYCKENGWSIYIDHTIHAKTYVFDRIKCIIGSANLTNKGIGLSSNSNKEASSFFEIDDEDYTKILSLYKDSIELDDALYSYIISHVNDQEIIDYKSYRKKDINIECLFPEDFPDSCTDIIELYNLRSYKWLIHYLEGLESKSSYFGEITACIHQIFVRDPRPYRKDIKQHLIDLLDAIKRLHIQEIKISRPNHSEKIELVVLPELIED